MEPTNYKIGDAFFQMMSSRKSLQSTPSPQKIKGPKSPGNGIDVIPLNCSTITIALNERISNIKNKKEKLLIEKYFSKLLSKMYRDPETFKILDFDQCKIIMERLLNIFHIDYKRQNNKAVNEKKTNKSINQFEYDRLITYLEYLEQEEELLEHLKKKELLEPGKQKRTSGTVGTLRKSRTSGTLRRSRNPGTPKKLRNSIHPITARMLRTLRTSRTSGTSGTPKNLRNSRVRPPGSEVKGPQPQSIFNIPMENSEIFEYNN